MSADYAVTVKVRNGRILSRMRALGIRNQSDLAQRIGVHPSRVGQILNMKAAPLRQNGEYAEVVHKIAAALRCSPDDLFTDRQKVGVLQHNETTVFMDEAQVEALTCGGGEEAAWAKIEAQRLLGILNPRSRAVVEARMGGASLEEIGAEYGVTPARIRQIEAKAIRVMRGRAVKQDRDVATRLL